MKKAFLKWLMAAGLLLSSVLCFAKSDLQFQLGQRLNNVSWTVEGHKGWYYSTPDKDYDECAKCFNFGLCNYNLFSPASAPAISFGFMEAISLYGGEYSSFGFDFLIGPALGIQAQNAFKIQCAFGLSVGTVKAKLPSGFTADDDSDSSGAVGCGVDFQIKFAPALRASPLVGIRYEYNSLDLFDVDIDNNAFCWYLGLAINMTK